MFARQGDARIFRKQLLGLSGSVIHASALMALWLPNILTTTRVYLLSDAYARLAFTAPHLADAQTWLVLNQLATLFTVFLLVSVECIGALYLWRGVRATFALVLCWLLPPLAFLFLRQASWTAMRYWLVLQAPMYWLLTAAAPACLAALEKFSARYQINRRLPTALVALASIALFQQYSEPFESWRFDDWRGASVTRAFGRKRFVPPYVLRFECQRALTRGTLRTFVIFENADGTRIVFPRQGGYVCPRGKNWHAASFAFSVLPGNQTAPVARIVLQNQGIGDALWRNLELRASRAP